MRAFRWVVLLAVLVTGCVLLPGEVSAQARRVVRRPATRSVVIVSARPYYRPYYYRPFYSFYGYGSWYGGWYPSPYYWQYPYPYPYYGGYYRDYTSSARLQVQPRHAEVFIDGYFVGLVDDFDGWLQRLNVQPGEHTLEVFLAGHRTYRQNVLFRPGATVKVEHVMQPLAAGEPADRRPTPSPSARQRPADQNYPERPDDRAPAPRRPMPPAQPPPRDAESREYGSLAIRVQPMDAQVLVDGETWQSPEAGSITLQLTDGAHRIEVRKDGFRTYSAEIRVRRGETTTLNVSLSR